MITMRYKSIIITQVFKLGVCNAHVQFKYAALCAPGTN